MDLSELIRLVRRAPAVLARLPLRTGLTMLHAGAVLVAVELTVRWIPLPRLARLLGVRLDLGPGRSAVPGQFALETLPERSRRRLSCTMRVADAWPLGHGPCLRRALVAGHLLKRHHPSVRVGVAKSGDSLVAHAWLEIDGQPLEVVSGYVPFERPIGQVP